MQRKQTKQTQAHLGGEVLKVAVQLLVELLLQAVRVEAEEALQPVLVLRLGVLQRIPGRDKKGADKRRGEWG